MMRNNIPTIMPKTWKPLTSRWSCWWSLASFSLQWGTSSSRRRSWWTQERVLTARCWRDSCFWRRDRPCCRRLEPSSIRDPYNPWGRLRRITREWPNQNGCIGIQSKRGLINVPCVYRSERNLSDVTKIVEITNKRWQRKVDQSIQRLCKLNFLSRNIIRILGRTFIRVKLPKDMVSRFQCLAYILYSTILKVCPYLMGSSAE